MEDNMELEVVPKQGKILDFSQGFKINSKSNVEIFSNITDDKKLFNLESKVDNLLNKCVGEKIRVKEVLIKRWIKPLENPVIDEETGEIIKDFETSISCILVDEAGKSYATGSKTFTYDLMRYLGDYGGAGKLEKGIEIEIIKKPVPNSSFEALGFELL